MNKTADDAELKRYRTGTHRTLAPEDTLQRARSRFDQFGIARVADVTGLDRIGIPVALAVRPNSRSVSVSQGKGLEADAARASAVMESIETWHAERIRGPVRFASALEMRAEGLLVADPDELARGGRHRFDQRTPIFWIEGRDLLNGDSVWLPREMVSCDYTLPLPPGSGYFAADTNGLASGNTLNEAICHGIFEVVERDADALWRHSAVRDQASCGIDIDSVDDPVCADLLERFTRAQIDIGIWDVTTDVGIASFVCLVAGDDDDWADPEFGAGCHPAREIALARALTEAAQARTTFIAGSRDDVGAVHYWDFTRRKRRRLCRELLLQHRMARRFGDVGSFEDPRTSGDLRWSLGRLRDIGIRQVLVVDLGLPDIGIAVVKIVIPGLEGAFGHHGGGYVPGRRARQRLNLPPSLAGGLA